MKNLTKLVILISMGLIFFTAGCATNRGIISLKQNPPKAPAQSIGKQVLINSVTDMREFQEKPLTQDIPSLGFGGASAASPEIKKRAIARKRNTYGKALGDILLEEGQSVETVMMEALNRSFVEMGYTVLKNQKDITPDTLVIDASIQKFWAYMTPGFWALALSTDISTTLQIKPPKAGQNQTDTITVKADDKFQTGSEGNWVAIIHQALNKYVEQVKITFSGKY
jgi:hypothetical protein